MSKNIGHVWHLTLVSKDGTKKERHYVTFSSADKAYSDAIHRLESDRSPVVEVYWTESWFYRET